MELVDQHANATPSGWTSGSEALYLYSLSSSTSADPGLDSNGLWVYLYNDGHPFALGNGIYNNINVTGSPVPVPPSLLLLGSGLMGMGLLGWRRRNSFQA